MKSSRSAKLTKATESTSTDNLSPAQRSHAMRQVKGKNTKPELIVRTALRNLGHTGYRLHRSDIPGVPDIAWIGKKLAIFINGCFWHGHSCPRGARVPKSKADYWVRKISRTVQRDTQNRLELSAAGWSVLTLWECELRDKRALNARLTAFLKDDGKAVRAAHVVPTNVADRI